MTLLAQTPVDATNIGGISDFAQKFGFSALLVLVLLYGIYLMQKRADAKQDARDLQDIEREKDRRSERETDRTAHVQALGQNTAALGTLGQVVTSVERKVDSLVARADAELRLVGKGGG